ncbi:hypothetical protein ABT112_13000 [Streptomyces sp. NPDC002055]|uniref:hypothetical protein n=1 Tax=Streptomyces sp. NPDC002055 TaxID=3154534 RepID=UPI003326B55F
MRRLTRADNTHSTTACFLRTGAAVAGAAAAGLLLAGCGTGGEGVRTEGPAQAGSTKVVPATPSPSPSAPSRVDAVKMLKNDPKVSDQIRKGLKPCAGEYPVDVSYGDITRNSAPDVVINVLTCGDAIGIGSYVYRENVARKKYENVFANEQPPVYAVISQGNLEVTQQTYAPGDSVSEPSGENITTYRWDDGRFTQIRGTRSEFSKSVKGSDPTKDPEG